MSDKETPDPNEPIPMTRQDHKTFQFHSEKLIQLSESTAELRDWLVSQTTKTEMLGKRCDKLRDGITFLGVIVAILALHAIGYID